MRTLTEKQVWKSFEEFPFLRWCCPKVSLIEKPDGTKMSLQVEVADADMLYQIPSSTEGSCYITTADYKYVGHQSVRAIAFQNENGALSNELVWDKRNSWHFLKDVLVYPVITRWVVLIRANIWWNYVNDWIKLGLKSYVGDFSHYHYDVTIYKAPDGGFDKLLKAASLTENVHINDIISLTLASEHGNLEARVFCAEVERLIQQAKIGLAPAWIPINEEKVARGMSGKFGGTELMSYVIAGRIMFTLTNGLDEISFVGDESDPTRTGLQSMNCTLPMGQHLLDDVIANWNPKLLKASNKVSLG